jgi:hypothetical protein|nr:hypothetical protein [uncultured Campylobacter sp.]DAR78006.1 MAG TPA: hypothetical protein [Caudoviricetes sp.]
MADYKEAYSELYKRVLGDTMAEDTPYNKFTTKIDEYFEKYGLANDKKFEMLCSTLVSMTQSVTTSSQDIALRLLSESEELPLRKQQLEAQVKIADADVKLKERELDLMEKKLNLADREAAFNEARTALIKEQTASEKKRGLAIDREIRSYDDKLRIQKASLLKDSVFGYSVGGLNPPAEMTTKMFNAIDRITP